MAVIKERMLLNQRYRLTSRLGAGGTGEVWLAEDQLNNCRVAIKIVSRASEHFDLYVASLRQEFLTLSRLSHHQISQVLDFGVIQKGSAQGTFYLVSEYLTGLKFSLAIRQLNSNEIVDLFVQGLRVLDFLHYHGVIHGDIKPANILIDRDAQRRPILRLIDFGAARVLRTHPYQNLAGRSDGREKMLVTPRYLAPEVSSEIDITAKTDLFALGATFLQLLTGKTNTSNVKILDKNYPKGFATILQRLVQPESRHRYHQARAVLEDCNRYLRLNLLLNSRPDLHQKIHQHRLFGREQLIQDLQSYLNIPAGSHSSAVHKTPVVVLRGEKGIGKTTLIASVIAAMKLHGWSSVALRPHHVEATFKKVICWLAKDTSVTVDFSSFADLMQQVDDNRLIFEIDDYTLFSLDEQRLLRQFIESIANLPKQGQVSVILAVDRHESDQLERVLRQVTELNNSFVPIWLDLLPLAESEAANLLEEMLGAVSVRTELRQLLLEQAGGNPLLMEQLVTLFADKGYFSKRLTPVSQKQLQQFLIKKSQNPIISILWQRYKALPERQQELLQVVSCLHYPMTAKLLMALQWFSSEALSQMPRFFDPTLLRRVEKGVVLRYPLLKAQVFATLQKSGRELVLRQQLVDALEKLLFDTPSLQLQDELVRQRLMIACLNIDAMPLPLEQLILVGENLHKCGFATQAFELYAIAATALIDRKNKVNFDASITQQLLLITDQLITNAKYDLAEALLAVVTEKVTKIDSHNSTLDLQIMHQQVRLARFTGKIERAVQIVDQGLALAAKDKNANALLQFAALKANQLIIAADFPNALKLSKSYLEQYEHLKLKCEPYIQLGLYYGHALRGLNRWQDAQKIYQEVLMWSEAQLFNAGIANSEQSLGIVAHHLQFADEASRHFERAAEVFMQTGNLAGQMSCRLSVANLQFVKGELFEALAGFEECATFYRSVSNKRALAESLMQLGELQLFVGFTKEGVDHLRFALWLADETKQPLLQAHCHQTIAFAECYQGHLLDAQLHIELAANAIQSLQQPERLELSQAIQEAFTILDDRHKPVKKLTKILSGNALLQHQRELLPIVFLLVRHGITSVGEIDLLRLLQDVEAKLLPLHLIYLRHMLLLLLPKASNLYKTVYKLYIKGLERMSHGLSEAMRVSLMSRWDFDVTEPIMNAAFLRADTTTEESTAQSLIKSQTASWQTDLKRLLDRINIAILKATPRERMQELLKIILELVAAQKAIIVYALLPNSESIRDHISFDQSIPSAIPSGFNILTWQESDKRLLAGEALRKNQKLLQAFIKTISGKLSQLELVEQQLLIPLAQQSRGRQGFVMIEKNDLSTMNAEKRLFCELLAIHLQQAMALLPTAFPLSPFAEPKFVKVGQALELPEHFVCASEVMRALLHEVIALKDGSSNITITGESGVGKDLLARIIHANSPRRTRPFVVVDCGAVSDELFESSFFGHLKGAFTGAHADKTGYFQAANGGTLYLDNVTELSLLNQAKLLRAIQEREIRKLGATEPEKIDIRLLASSQESIADRTHAGKFRLDLYYRLEVIQLVVPPLRERQADLLPLIESFLNQMLATKGGQRLTFSTPALQALLDYQWPGNIRELWNEVERALLTHDASKDGLVIEKTTLSPKVQSLRTTLTPVANKIVNKTSIVSLSGTLKEVEKSLITAALDKHASNITKTATALGLSRDNLRKRMKKLKIRSQINSSGS